MEVKLFEDYDAEELERLDYRLLGLEKQIWAFKRGAKSEKFFTDPETGKKKVRISYINAESADGRVITPTHKRIEWMLDDETVGHTLDVDVKYSLKKEETVLRDIRQGQIDYLNKAAQNLEDQADQLPASPPLATVQAMVSGNLLPDTITTVEEYETFRSGLYQIVAALESMFSHWGTSVSSYIDRGTIAFENEVINEADPTFLFVLSQLARVPDTEFPVGLTVRQSIMYQLTGVKP